MVKMTMNQPKGRKHVRTHEKPFHCNWGHCVYALEKGFITLNDQDRHMKSKHPDRGSKVPQHWHCVAKQDMDKITQFYTTLQNALLKCIRMTNLIHLSKGNLAAKLMKNMF
jgi:hypothetical protein